MSPIISVPVYCGITGCWQVAKIDGHDCKDHPFHACTPEHADKLRADRSRTYADIEMIVQYWRDHWADYARKF